VAPGLLYVGGMIKEEVGQAYASFDFNQRQERPFTLTDCLQAPNRKRLQPLAIERPNSFLCSLIPKACQLFDGLFEYTNALQESKAPISNWKSVSRKSCLVQHDAARISMKACSKPPKEKLT
jgi:hypothetical protein